MRFVPPLMVILLLMADPCLSVCRGETSSSATLITREEIERDKPTSIAALLREKVGVDEQGGQVYMRGVKGVVVVVDDVIQSTIPSSLQPEDVERIEILRGAASARFGSSAMGGAVVIRTRKGTSYGMDLIGAFGSFGRRYEKAVVTGKTENWGLRVTGREEVMRKNYIVGRRDTPFPYLIYVRDDYSRTRGVQTDLTYKGKKLESGLSFGYEKSFAIQGRPNWKLESENITAKWNLTVTPLSWLELSSLFSIDYWPVYGGIRDKGTGVDASGLAPDQSLDSNTVSGSYELRAVAKKWDSATLTLGNIISLDRERSTNRDYYSGEKRFEYRFRMLQEGCYLLLETRPVAALNIDLSGRWDMYRYTNVAIDDGSSSIKGKPLTKNSFNPKAGIKWKVSDALTLRGSAGTGFVPPSPYNLYYEDLSNPGSRVISNPGLKPERSLTVDAGVDLIFPFVEAGITPFYTLWMDKVAYVYTVTGSTSAQRAENIGKSNSIGVELQLRRKLSERWNVFFNYTYNKSKITKNSADTSTVGNNVPNMPRHKYNLGVIYEKKDDYSFKAIWRYVGSSFLDQKNTVTDSNGFRWKRRPYHVVDLTAVKRFSFGGLIKGADLTLNLENLFNSRYDKYFFYRAPGRTIMGEVKVRF